MHLFSLVLGFLLLVGFNSEIMAASAKAQALRQANGLSEFTPPEKFLAGNFVADEMNPTVIFGAVKSLASSRKYPITWLIEAGEKNRLAQAKADTPEEYTVYLEEDCPDKVVYYVFIDQSALTPQQWIEWRQKFHKSKTEQQYGPIKSKLDQACTEGCGVGAELRFIQQDGELIGKSPEEVLRVDLKFPAIYDLVQRKQITK